MTTPCRFVAMFFVALLIASPSFALDDEHQKKAQQVIQKGIDYLRKNQGKGPDGKTVDRDGKPLPEGAWSPKFGPAVTGFALQVLLDQPNAKLDDPVIKKALDYILSKKPADGGIHDGILENYNTSICLSALSRISNEPGIKERIKLAQQSLRNYQWVGERDLDGKKITITEDHPFYGGTGYGSSGRPDLNNLQFTLQAMHDSGIDCNDPVFKQAMVFITKLQGSPANKEHSEKIAPDGGAIYSTSVNKDKQTELESKAGTDDKGRLRTYGSMTYAMFKSYLYAGIDRNDQRVQDAMKWIRNNYNLDCNPGIPDGEKTNRKMGYYNYLMTFSLGLKAWNEPTIKTADGKINDWANDLIDKLASLQKEDGSWKNENDRWEEGDAYVVTCYTLIALQTAIK